MPLAAGGTYNYRAIAKTQQGPLINFGMPLRSGMVKIFLPI
jgi:hypothetical protein